MAATTYVTFLHAVQAPTVRALLATIQGVINTQGGKPSIYLLMSTPGGSVDEGIMLFNALRALPITLTTHNIGNVDSIGNVVFLAGSKRLANANATFMWHGVGFDVTTPQRFELKNVREMLSGIEAHTARMASTIAGRSALTKEQIHELFLEATTKDAAYAKAHDLVHEIADAAIPDGGSLIHAPAA
jgi:ATP-dependent protease ClpP protease subunit